MLTVRQNLMETIRGGSPDRFVNQFEFMALIKNDPFRLREPRAQYGKGEVVDSWGVTFAWPIGTPGIFPVHDEKHIRLKDVTRWKEELKAPCRHFGEEEWLPAITAAEEVDRNERFVTAQMTPGIFELSHHLMSITGALEAFYEEPESYKDLLKYLGDWEIEYARDVIKYLKPDALFHHDDWGSQKSTFFSPAMFEEFILPVYKEVYGFYKENGVELIVHHSDSYAATLVPAMIDMGIDIWQGVMDTNDTPSLIRKYGGRISFMGDINSAKVDHPGWTRAEVAAEVERACRANGKLYYIPCATVGGPTSTFEGVYQALGEEIDKMSRIMF